MKFCKDCKHHFSGRCQSPQAETQRDPVTGEWPTALLMRCSQLMDCGRTAARWFEPTFTEGDK